MQPMQFSDSMQMSGNTPFLVLVAGLTSVVGLFTTIFWVVVGWRAMRAHEEIAAALRERRGPATTAEPREA